MAFFVVPRIEQPAGRSAGAVPDPSMPNDERKPGASFEKLITEATLSKLAGERSFARGADYFEGGAVTDLVQTGGAIKARVRGNDEYRVELKPGKARLEWSCTCPLGDEGEFCKHAVAAGLAWLARGGEQGDDLGGLRSHLDSESKESLVALIVEQAASDPELRARLQAAAFRRRPPSDLKALKDEVRKAFAVRGFVDYHGMRTFIARADGIADLLRDLLEGGRAADAVVLADYAMRRGISAYERTDDSGGGFGETLRRIAALHLEACRVATPELDALAGDFLELQVLDQWGFFEFENYAPLLGEKGLARYRALAEALWAKVPERKPGDKREPGDGRFAITEIMTKLARHGGDADALVAVKSRDLSRAHAFLEIAEILSRAGRHGEALAWAERGRSEFPNDINSPLVDFLVGAYQRADRHQDAIRTAWEDFVRHPGLAGYERLEKSARRGKARPAWRDKALEHVRIELKRTDRGRGTWHWAGRGHTLLVEIFLHEGDSDAALAEANSGGCTASVWMQLARAREKDHPQDAAAIYRQAIERIVDLKNNRAYDEATELARKIKALMERAGGEKEFAEWLAALRVRHKAKRNLMQRMEALS